MPLSLVGERHHCRCALSSARDPKFANVALALAIIPIPIVLGDPLPSQGFFFRSKENRRRSSANRRKLVAAPLAWSCFDRVWSPGIHLAGPDARGAHFSVGRLCDPMGGDIW